MDFSKLNNVELEEFLQYYSLLTPTEWAEILFKKLRQKPDINYPNAIVDLYIASNYQGPKDKTYTEQQILNMSEENINTFLALFGIVRDINVDVFQYKQRILRILKFLDLIQDDNQEGNILTEDQSVNPIQDDTNQEGNILTGNQYADINILSYLNDEDLAKICLTNKYTNNLCQSDDLWNAKISMLTNTQVIKDKSNNQSAKDFYFYLKDLLNKNKDQQLANKAASNGNLNVLKWLAEKNILPDQEGVNSAAHFEKFNVLEWLAGRNILPDQDAADRATISGHLDVIKWLAKKDILPTESGIIKSYRSENYNIIKWLEDEGFLSFEQ